MGKSDGGHFPAVWRPVIGLSGGGVGVLAMLNVNHLVIAWSRVIDSALEPTWTQQRRYDGQDCEGYLAPTVSPRFFLAFLSA